jgi:hypothetical protein
MLAIVAAFFARPAGNHTSASPGSGSAAPATKEERLSALADAQYRHENAAVELGRLKTRMEEALGEEESVPAFARIKADPDSFKDARRPIFRKTAAAVKEEQEAAAQVAALEQEIRDHSMSPADMLVEVRSLIRKQNEGFEKMRTENEALVQRVSTLEAVVKALVTLPQLSVRPSDFEFAASEGAHEARQGGPTTLLHHATQLQLAPVVDYLLSFGITPKEQHSLVVLDPPEERRSYQTPKEQTESSMLNQQGGTMWVPFKQQQQSASWVQLDAGRKVQLMGWRIQRQGSGGLHHVFELSVSDDGKTWKSMAAESISSNSGFAESISPARIATARYFRLTLKEYNRGYLRFGLLILDDHGEYLVGPKRVRDLSPLHIAAKMGDTNQIDKLLRHGADLELLAECWKPTMFDDFSPGTTPLQLAATSASLPAVQMLVERGAQVDKAIFRVPQGKDGDLVAGFLQTHGSKPVHRIGA